MVNTFQKNRYIHVTQSCAYIPQGNLYPYDPAMLIVHANKQLMPLELHSLSPVPQNNHQVWTESGNKSSLNANNWEWLYLIMTRPCVCKCYTQIWKYVEITGKISCNITQEEWNLNFSNCKWIYMLSAALYWDKQSKYWIGFKTLLYWNQHIMMYILTNFWHLSSNVVELSQFQLETPLKLFLQYKST